MSTKVVYRKDSGKRRPGYALLFLCGALLFGFSLVNLLWPKRTQLELENRKAASFPAFSVSTLLDGSWQSGFSRWMQDQFAFRDAAVNTQRAADEVLFQKVEEGGILLGKEELAQQVFDRQAERIAPLLDQQSTGKSCAFFSISANNLANVRKGGDYVAQMIEMAGGDYVFADLTDNGNNLSTMNLPLEDFYAGAKDADVLLYNSTIEGVVHTTEELVAKCPLLAEFKAVQSGSVWCTTQSFFQQSTALVDFVLDLHRVFTENDPADLQFLRKVE